MYCEAEPTFEGANVILEEVGVFVEIDGFEGEFAEAFAAVGVGSGVRCYTSAAKLGTGSVLREESVSSLFWRLGLAMKWNACLVIHDALLKPCEVESVERESRRFLYTAISWTVECVIFQSQIVRFWWGGTGLRQMIASVQTSNHLR